MVIQVPQGRFVEPGCSMELHYFTDEMDAWIALHASWELVHPTLVSGEMLMCRGARKDPFLWASEQNNIPPSCGRVVEAAVWREAGWQRGNARHLFYCPLCYALNAA